MNKDTDIGPMNAGIDQWGSDEQEEEPELGEAVDVMRPHQWQSQDIGRFGLSGQESEDGVRTRSLTMNVTGVRSDVPRRPVVLNVTDVRRDVPRRPVVINVTDIVRTDVPRRLVILPPDEPLSPRQFGRHLEQFAEDNSSRRGAPPAATSFIENLPSVVISTSHETNGGVVCPVCKEQMPAESTATQLPCLHLYHSSCILPWLSSRNTCPACRYELPTDDPKYEMSKQATADERNVNGVEHANLLEVEENSDGPEVEGALYTTSGTVTTVEQTNTTEHVVHPPEQPSGAGGTADSYSSQLLQL